MLHYCSLYFHPAVEAGPHPLLSLQALIAVGEGSDELHREVHELSAEGDGDSKPGENEIARIMKDPTGSQVHDRKLDKVLNTVDEADKKAKAKAKETAKNALPAPVAGRGRVKPARTQRREDSPSPEDRPRRSSDKPVDTKPAAAPLIPKVRVHIPTSKTVKQLRKLVKGTTPIDPKFAKFHRRFISRLRGKVCIPQPIIFAIVPQSFANLALTRPLCLLRLWTPSHIKKASSLLTWLRLMSRGLTLWSA